jgi:hypothetical protein
MAVARTATEVPTLRLFSAAATKALFMASARYQSKVRESSGNLM